MRRTYAPVLIAAATLLIAASFGSQSHAQGVRRPTVSPYLNLLRSSGTPAENYYNLVRPELLFRQSLQQQGRQIQQLQRGSVSAPQSQARTTPGPTAIPGTGHTSYYQIYSHYYLFTPINRRR